MQHDQTTPSFSDLGIRPPLVRALAARGITEPFPIQSASIPTSLTGADVLGRGRTGSGKTVAFALPMIERLLASAARTRPGRPRALILVPTRELAVQVAETVEYLADAVRLRVMTVFGGVRYTAQLRRLERGVDIVIATPGRLEDLIEQGALTLGGVEVVVLDEADLMADMGFLPPVTRLLEQTPPGQRMLFSATLDSDVQVVVDRFLQDPFVHSVDEERSTPDTRHLLLLVTMANKAAIVRELSSGGGRTLLFTRTKTFAERLARELNEAGISAAELHGNLRQAGRQRNLAAFADGSVSVLVATDIAARGIHVDDIGLVVHVDPPGDPKAFLHRSGRTSRAGAEGTVVTLSTKIQNKLVRSLMAQAKIKPIQHVVAPGDPLLAELRAPKLAPNVRRGSSMFEPDPEDALEQDAAPRGRRTGEGDRRREDRGRTPRPAREARGAERPWERARPRDDRARPSDRDQRPERAPRNERGWRDVGEGDRRARRSADDWAAFQNPEAARARGARPTQPAAWGRDVRRPDADRPGRGFGRDERRSPEYGRRSERPTAANGGRGERSARRGEDLTARWRDDRPARSGEARPKKARWSDADRAKAAAGKKVGKKKTSAGKGAPKAKGVKRTPRAKG